MKYPIDPTVTIDPITGPVQRDIQVAHPTLEAALLTWATWIAAPFFPAKRTKNHKISIFTPNKVISPYIMEVEIWRTI